MSICQRLQGSKPAKAPPAPKWGNWMQQFHFAMFNSQSSDMAPLPPATSYSPPPPPPPPPPKPPSSSGIRGRRATALWPSGPGRLHRLGSDEDIHVSTTLEHASERSVGCSRAPPHAAPPPPPPTPPKLPLPPARIRPFQPPPPPKVERTLVLQQSAMDHSFPLPDLSRAFDESHGWLPGSHQPPLSTPPRSASPPRPSVDMVDIVYVGVAPPPPGSPSMVGMHDVVPDAGAESWDGSCPESAVRLKRRKTVSACGDTKSASQSK